MPPKLLIDICNRYQCKISLTISNKWKTKKMIMIYVDANMLRIGLDVRKREEEQLKHLFISLIFCSMMYYNNRTTLIVCLL